jgi:hypothetical protein
MKTKFYQMILLGFYYISILLSEKSVDKLGSDLANYDKTKELVKRDEIMKLNHEVAEFP